MKLIFLIFKYFFPIFFFASSCKNENKENDLIGSNFNFQVDSLIPYNNFEYQNSTGSLKILVFLKMDCPSCVEEIYKLNTLFQQKPFSTAQLYIVLSGQPSEYTYYHLIELNKFNFKILYDQNDYLIKSNSIGFIAFDKYLLLSPSDKILVIGSPFISQKKKRTYIRQLNR